MSNDFDMACRRMAKASPTPFLAWLIRDFAATARHVGWVDTRRIAFPGRPDQTGDLVFELELLAEVQALWAVALEFQLEPDPQMFGRLLVYLGTIWLERHPDALRGGEYQLGACVVNLTGTPRSVPATRRFVFPGADGTECILVVRERYLSQEPAEDLLDAVAAERYDRALLPWVPLMRGGSDPAVIARCVELADAETDAERRANFAYDTLVFAEKCADPGAWRKALEGWNVVRSETMEKSRREGQQELLLRILAARAGREVPEEVADKVRACYDATRLDAWGVTAATVDTLDDFRRQTGL